MQVAVVGSGAVGLFYGAHLAAGGAEVTFLLRSALAEAAESGIRVRSPDGDVHLAKPRIAATTAEIGPSDWVIVATKATGNAQLPALLRPLVHNGTSMITLQNGLGQEEELAAEFPDAAIAGGLCFVCLNRTSPAAVVHLGHGSMTIGQLGGPPAPQTRDLARRWRARGIQIDLADDLAEARWRKLIWNIPFNGLPIASDLSGVDGVLANPSLLRRCRTLMEEVRAIALAEGRAIEPEFLDWQIERTRPMGGYKPSSLVDFENGKEVEIEAIWGRALDRAKAAGVAVPELAALHRELLERCPQPANPL